VVALELDDIDWRASEITIRESRSRRHDRAPCRRPGRTRTAGSQGASASAQPRDADARNGASFAEIGQVLRHRAAMTDRRRSSPRVSHKTSFSAGPARSARAEGHGRHPARHKNFEAPELPDTVIRMVIEPPRHLV
jgi:hypothetical protein